MKKQIILLTAALGVGSLATAQNTSSPEIREFLNSPAFIKSIVATYGVNSEITPKPENSDITAIQAAEALLRSDQMGQLQAGINSLVQYMNTTTASGEGKFSALIPQIVGAVNFRLSTMVSGSQQAQFRREAIRYLTEATNMFPGYRDAYKNLARLHFQAGDEASLTLAAKNFSKALQLGDKEAATYVLLSKIYFDQGKFSAAETAARQAIMMDPSITESRTLLAYSLFQQERFSEAKAVFEEMLLDDPNDADIWQMISNAYIQGEQIDEAAKRLEIVRFMDKATTDTLLLLGDVYMNKDMVEDAAEAYEEALGLSTKESKLRDLKVFLRPVETLNNFQAFELGMDLLGAVEKTYENVLEDSQRNDILALRSEINIALGKGEEAAKNLRDILDIDPMNRRALLSLGQYYTRWKSSNPDEDLAREERQRAVQNALNFFRRAQELINTGSPEDEEAARQAFVGEGQLMARERRLQEALEALNAAQSIRKENRIGSYIEMIQRVVASRS
jgi:tetratricopeptide (TPR) repeat protein